MLIFVILEIKVHRSFSSITVFKGMDALVSLLFDSNI